MGPTVWELDGPIPILNKSKALMLIVVMPAVADAQCKGGVEIVIINIQYQII